MKLTGILKNKVDKAETMAEKKDLIAEAGMELNDNELEMVTGGIDDWARREVERQKEMRDRAENDIKKIEKELMEQIKDKFEKPVEELNMYQHKPDNNIYH